MMNMLYYITNIYVSTNLIVLSVLKSLEGRNSLIMCCVMFPFTLQYNCKNYIIVNIVAN